MAHESVFTADDKHQLEIDDRVQLDWNGEGFITEVRLTRWQNFLALFNEVDSGGHAMFTFLNDDLHNAIRNLSISILTPDDPQHDLDAKLRIFNQMVVKLHHLQEALHKSLKHTQSLSGQIMKV